MSKSFDVRLIGEREAERLALAFPEPGAPADRHGARRDLQEQGQGVYLIAWRDERPVGWVFVKRPGSSTVSERAGRLVAAELEDLFVAEPFRGEGYGSALLAAAEAVA